MNPEELIGFAIPVTYLSMYIGERLWPARNFPKVSWWGAVGIVCLLLMMTVGVMAPLLIPVEFLATHRLLDGSRLGVVGGAFAGFVLIEFVVYAYHRACHKSSLMWRAIHQMHHAPSRLDIPGAVLFHPFELAVQNALSIGFLVFVLGLEPLAVALIGYALAFCSLFQHWNVRTPRWLGYFIQRPEAHCHHHELNVHASNYADLPFIDMLFGTFKNPEEFSGKVGFSGSPSYKKMLIGIDVSNGAAG
jgi:sterol desaturase/sphingolipid hydroxylase (fatty acid hydroxylase superfamily)